MGSLKHLLQSDTPSDEIKSSSNLDWIYDPVTSDAPAFEGLDLSWSNVLNDCLNPLSNAAIAYNSQLDYGLEYEFPSNVGLDIEAWARQDNSQGQEENVSLDEAYSGIAGNVQELLCYGMIYRTRIRLTGSMQKHLSSLSAERTIQGGSHCVMSISRDDSELHVILSDRTKFAIMNKALNNAFGSDSIYSKVVLQVVAPLNVLHRAIRDAKRAHEAHVNVDINVYGSEQEQHVIGDHLTKQKIWLQRPDWNEAGKGYKNPQTLQLTHGSLIPAKRDSGPGLRGAPSENPEIGGIVSEIYSSLTRAAHLERTAGDVRLATPLLPHQEAALHFMVERESGPISEEYLLWKPTTTEDPLVYQHCITAENAYELPPETGGGILADEMGMGKTFSMLALIIRTLEDARSWSKDPESHLGELSCEKLSKATLIIVPSPLILNNWISELGTRVGMSELTYLVYHGTHRARDAAFVTDYDIVLTTYQTLVAERSRGEDLLSSIGWYRVVLDEAHFIRRSTTKFHRCVSELEAKSRWCLTGTPIQNHLDDIGALFAFLRIEPFDRMGIFRKHISLPYNEGQLNRLTCRNHLKLLIDSTCLRRERSLLSLDKVDEVDHAIDFSPEERYQYQKTKSEVKSLMELHPNGLNDENRFGMFHVQLHLRLICNHGTYQQSFGLHSMANRLDMRDDILSFASLDGEVRCDSCDQPIRILSGDDFVRLKPFSCQHMFCEECYTFRDTKLARCDRCGSPELLRTQDGNTNNGESKTSRLNSTGKSSKLQALLHDLSRCAPEDKSIVFSCWTSTLDHIERHLRQLGIQHRRIDGDVPLKERESILEQFDSDQAIKVLVMTTGVGGFGINLIAANRVYLYEPQWNPSVESQAIGRTLRIGQNRRVQVTRYFVRGTIEEDIRGLQHNKAKIAKFAGASS